MYSQITSNKRKTIFLITVFLVFIIGLAFLFAQIYPDYSFILPLAVILAAISSFASYYWSDKIVLSISRAKEIEKSDNPQLYRLVENLAITSGLPLPKIYIIQDSAPNAFATGRDPEHAVICVTNGLLEKLEKAELEGVIGHELSHIKNYDIRLQTIVVTLVGILALMSDFFLRFTWFSSRRRKSNDENRGEGQIQIILLVVGIVFAVLAPIAGTLIQLAISRRREFLADADSALLTRYPPGLARALIKIAQDEEILEASNKATAHLFIVNPLRGRKVSKFFSTHPSLEERVKALESMKV